MYGFDKVTKVEQVTRLASGEVQCGHSHYAGAWSYRDQTRPAAVAVIYDDSYGRGELAFACRRHLGTVKAGITKASWSFRDAQVLDVSVQEAAKDPALLIKATSARIAAEKAERQRQMEERDLAYRRDTWAAKRDEYLLNSDVTFEAFSPPDEYGRVYVNLVIGSKSGYGSRTHLALTPGQVRKIVEFAGKWADNAERLTCEQVMP